MKGKIFLTVMFLLVAANFISAKPNQKERLYIKQAEENLESDIENIVDASLFNIMMLKIKYPSLDFNELDKNLDQIILNQKSKKLSNKAYLVKLFLRSNLNYDKDDIKQFVKNPDQFFEILVSNFKEQLIAKK